jgi:uncharacterized protein (UPF0371 family)
MLDCSVLAARFTGHDYVNSTVTHIVDKVLKWLGKSGRFLADALSASRVLPGLDPKTPHKFKVGSCLRTKSGL